MPRYFFYPRNAGGTALTFEVFEFPDRAAAVVRCAELLADHASAIVVEVWEGERLIHAELRDGVGEPDQEQGPDPAHV